MLCVCQVIDLSLSSLVNKLLYIKGMNFVQVRTMIFFNKVHQTVLHQDYTSTLERFEKKTTHGREVKEYNVRLCMKKIFVIVCLNKLNHVRRLRASIRGKTLVMFILAPQLLFMII